MNAPSVHGPAGPTAAASSTAGFEAATADVLRALLAHGPLRPADLPHRWPLTRLHLPALVAMLVAREWVTPAGSDDGDRVQLTAVGRRVAST